MITTPRQSTAQSIAAAVKYTKKKVADLANAIESMEDDGVSKDSFAYTPLAQALKKANQDYAEVANQIFIRKED